eukprot:gene7208-8372_t
MHIDPDAHESKVECLHWLFDGVTLVSGSKDSNIKAWDALNGFKLLETLNGHKAPVLCFSYSPLTKQLASAGRDSSIKLWDASTLDLSHRAKRADDSSIKTALTTSFDGHRGDVTSLVFTKDGSQLFSGARDNEIKLWNVATGDEIRSLKTHRGDVTHMALLNNDSILLTSSIDGTVKCTKLGVIKNTHGESDVIVLDELKHDLDLDLGLPGSPGSSLSSPGGVRDEKDSLLFSLEAHDLIGVATMRVSPDGAHLLTASADRSVRVWRFSTGTERPTLLHEFVGHRGPVTTVCLLAGSESFISGSTDYNVFLYDIETMSREASFNFEGSVSTLVVGSKNGQQVVFVGGTHYDIKAYCLSSNGEASPQIRREVARYSGHSGKVLAIAVNPDCTMMVSSGNDFDLIVWNIKMPFVPRDDYATERPAHKHSAHKGHTTSLDFSETGTMVVSAGTDHSLIFWEVSSKKLSRHFVIEQAHSSVVSTAIFGRGPSSQYAFSASWDGSIKVWSYANKSTRPMNEMEHAHDSRISSLAISPDGSTLVSSSSDGKIRTWQATAPFALICEYTSTDAVPINRVHSGRDIFISASDNGMIRCWPHLNQEYAKYFNQ